MAGVFSMAINSDCGSFHKPVESSDKQDKQDNSRLHNVDMKSLMSDIKTGPTFTKEVKYNEKGERLISDRYFQEKLLPTFESGLGSFKENNANVAAVSGFKENSKVAKIYESDEAFRKAFGIAEKEAAKPAVALSDKPMPEACKVEASKNIPSLDTLVKVRTVSKQAATEGAIENGADTSLSSSSRLSETKAKDRSAEASKMLASRDAAAQAEQEYKGIENSAKDGKFKGSVERVGDATIYKNEKGEEVFRRQGDIATVTKDGIRYSFNEKTGVKEVRGQDGKLQVRVFKDGQVETPDGAGNTIRLEPKSNRVAVIGADGKIISELTDIEGNVKGNVQSLQYQTVDEMPAKDDPKALTEQMDRLFAEKKLGQVTFKDGSVAYLNETTDENGRVTGRFFTYVNADGTMAARTENGTVFHVSKDKQVSVVSPWGGVRKATPEQIEELKKIFTPKDMQNTLAAFGIKAADGTTTTVTNGTTTVERDDAKITTSAQGTVIFEDKVTGNTFTKKPRTPGLTVSSADGRSIVMNPKGVTVDTGRGNLQVDNNGTITDQRNGTVMDNKGIRTTDGINYNSQTGMTSFGNGDVLDAHGVLRSGDGLSHGISKDSSEMAMEAKAHSAVASAESIASSILAKAASGKVSSGDIAALNAAISGLEVNIKALSEETDPSAMIRLMMAKDSVSSSRDRAQDIANLQKDGKAPLDMVA